MSKQNDQFLLDQALNQRMRDLELDISINQYFEVFSVEQTIKEMDLSDDEISNGIVDGARDGGVDSVYLFVNSELIQEDSEVPNLKREFLIDLYK